MWVKAFDCLWNSHTTSLFQSDWISCLLQSNWKVCSLVVNDAGLVLPVVLFSVADNERSWRSSTKIVRPFKQLKISGNMCIRDSFLLLSERTEHDFPELANDILFKHIFGVVFVNAICPSHKSCNAPGEYPTMHHFVTERCTYVHISVTKWRIMGYGIGVQGDFQALNSILVF